MLSSRSLSICVCAALVACGGAAPAPSAPPAATSSQRSPLRFVPADTPYLYVGFDTRDTRPRDGAARDHGWQVMSNAFWNPALANLPPALTAEIHALFAEHAKQPGQTWSQQLGLAPDFHAVIYGLSLWPVVRIGVADPQRITNVIQRVLAASNLPIPAQTLGAHRYWAVLFESHALVASVGPDELVLALVDRGTLDRALPYLVGTQLPPRSIADAPALAALRRLGDRAVGFVDLQRFADIAQGRAPGLAETLGARNHGLDADCLADAARFAGAVPRLSFAVSRDDAEHLDLHAILALPTLAAPLRELRTLFGGRRVPELRSAVIAAGMAVDLDALIALLRTRVIDPLRAAPPRCADLAEVPMVVDLLALALDNAARTRQNVHGFVAALEDYAPTTQRATGLAIIDAAGLAPLVATVAPHIASNGAPTSLSLRPFGLGSTAHIALTPSRLAVVIGDDATRGEAHVARALQLPDDPNAPLAFLRADAAKAVTVLAAMKRPFDDELTFRRFAIDAFPDADGLRLDVAVGW